MLWNHQMVDGSGRVKPCCRFGKDDMPDDHYLQEKSLKEIFYSDFMQELREKSFEGKRINGCVRCYQEEDNGKKSLRQRLNDNLFHTTGPVNFQDPKIKYLELAISNDCNLMCRMCDSRYSWKLYDEELEYFKKTHLKEKKTRSNIDCAYELLEDLRYIKFTGGEPLIIKEHWELLQTAVEKGYAKNITLNYSTNCTVWPKKRIVDIWKEFKKIELAVSLDSINANENEYQRHLTDHTQAIKNILKYVELSKTKINMQLLGRPTVSIMNVYTIPETVEWLEANGISANPSHVTFPDWQSVTVLPLKDKLMLKEKFENFKYSSEKTKTHCMYIINYMMSKDESHRLEEFKKHTSFLDKKRGQSFKELYPYFDFL